MITTEDIMHLEEACSGCTYLLKAKGNDYPVCKIGKFREMDITNRMCPNKRQE